MAIPDDIKALFPQKTLPALGPERRPDAFSLSHCQKILDATFHTSDFNERTQQLIRSAALLWHDHLDESHTLSQEIHDADGSFLHGLMHRREPDYPNAKYWLTRTGQHDAFQTINTRSAEVFKHSPLAQLALQEWNPHDVIDAVSQAAPDSCEYWTLQEIQRIEFEVLIEHFCR